VSFLGAVPLFCAVAIAPAGCAPGEDSSKSSRSGSSAGPKITAITPQEIPALVRDESAKLVLVNVWATWCQPCVAEFPDLVQIHRDYAKKGVRVTFITDDSEENLEAARRFLVNHGVDFETYRKTGSDKEFIDNLSPQWSGALPGTFLFGKGGQLLHFWEGKQTFDAFERRILEVLGE
jgi:thiol-disulfide isomerase/thioredoxin